MSEDTSSKSSLNNSTSSSLSGDLSFTSQLIYQLRLLSVHRSKLIDQIQGKVGAYVCAHLESSIIFHFTVVVTTSYLLLSMFRHEHTVTLFSMHPIFMSIGSIFFVAEGMVSYRNRFLVESLSPIMQHSKRMKNRAIHQSVMVMGGCCILLGLLFIVANKIEYAHSIMPMSIHSIIGSCCIILLIVQATSGSQKMDHIMRNNTKIRRWHGDSGLLLWDLLCFAIMTGILKTFYMMFFTLISLLTLTCLTWYTTHLQMRRNKAAELRTDDEIETEDDMAMLLPPAALEKSPFISDEP